MYRGDNIEYDITLHRNDIRIKIGCLGLLCQYDKDIKEILIVFVSYMCQLVKLKK